MPQTQSTPSIKTNLRSSARKPNLPAIITTGLLVLGLVVSVVLVQRQTRLSSEAAGDVIVSMSAPSEELSRNQSFPVTIAIDTKTKSVSAVELQVTIPEGLEFEGFVPGNFFNNNKGQSATDISVEAGLSKYDPTTRIARLILGAPCDECEIVPAGGTPDGRFPLCPTIPQATCYEKKGAGPLAILTLRVSGTAQPGQYAVNFENTTQAAAVEVIDSGDDNVIAANGLSGTSVTVADTGSGEPTACDADIDQSGFVDLADYQALRSDFFSSNPSNPRSDIDDSGLVDLGDYQILRNFFFDSCNG